MESCLEEVNAIVTSDFGGSRRESVLLLEVEEEDGKKSNMDTTQECQTRGWICGYRTSSRDKKVTVLNV